MNRETQSSPADTFLERILDHVRDQVALRRARTPEEELVQRPFYREPRRGFAGCLAGTTKRCIVAEIKRASPSKGLIRPDFEPVAIAREYAQNGAVALSVVTEERFFEGSLEYLSSIRQAVSLPLLRKDFVVDPYQIVEARSFGADAVLLIATVLAVDQLKELQRHAQTLSLDVLVEVHTEGDLDRALESGARLVGINNRNLHTFEVDLSVSERLLRRIPRNVLAVCESGIEGVEQLRRLETAGSHAFLIGETLMRAPKPGAKLAELLEHR